MSKAKTNQYAPIEDDLELEETTPEPELPQRPRTYTVKAGDTYASIAKRFKPAGVKTHAYATDLFGANGGKALRPGATVLL